ncbi:DUF6702 family protein [Sphingobacterium cellulitidis]|uniref:DUF6702 family protein n=1 Tax=Sphingobacterium cellulitidis TaxID=1768011 RepID=UPI000B93F7A3|nr:hypothetical protein CHT99_09080 [Sphingobacterium cellulitidis]
MKLKKIRLGLVLLGIGIALFAYAHPFYVSITSIDFNPNKKRIEVSCRLFYDDLEMALKNQLGQHIDVIHPKNKAQADSAISKYIRQNLKINVNNKAYNLQYVGYEIEEDVVWCYLELKDISAVSKLDIVNQLLYKDFKSQSNIMHIKVSDKKKSTKLDNPKRTASFTF